MKWDFEIDRVITTLLIHSKEPRYDSDIFEHLKKSSKKQISPTTYTAHKKKLIDANIIEKIEVDRESGGKIQYDMWEEAKERHRLGIKYGMTEKAKERHRLGILLFNTTDEISFGLSETQEEKQLKVFFLLLFYSTRYHMYIRHELLRTYYKYPLPGFNISEILDESCRLMFPDDVFPRSNIQESLDSLDNEGIIVEIAVNDGEVRYDLANPLLKLFFESFWKIWNDLLEAVLAKWYFKSSYEERRWLKRIFGRKKVDALERFHYSKRTSFRRYEKDIEKKIKDVDGRYRRLLLQNAKIVGKYRCLIEPFLEFLYPTPLRKRYRSPDIVRNRSELRAQLLKIISSQGLSKEFLNLYFR